MRVFDTYYFNIADKVSFQETKPYLDRMLAELGYNYGNIAFILYDPISKPTERLFRDMPDMKKYYFTESSGGLDVLGVTSSHEDWQDGNIHADKEDWDAIARVFAGVPRRYGFHFGELILDGVNWFGDSNDSLAVTNWDEMDTPVRKPFLSNRIMQLRSFDDGKKRNTIIVTIEVTSSDGIRSSRPVIEKLEPWLGKPYRTAFSNDTVWRQYAFARDEFARQKALCILHSKALDQAGESMLPKSPHTIGNLPDKKLEHVADKYATEKAFKGTGFTRVKGQPNGFHLYSCADENGFLYEAFVQKLFTINGFRCWIEVSSHNFGIHSDLVRDYYVSEEQQSADIIKAFAGFCVWVRDSYGEKLLKDFGKKPAWYNE
ncbi:MAG: hypothetical protein IJ048_06585 [Clostridia bacterium]|nr:hypothetical protein [Clostridia bacterium]